MLVVRFSAQSQETLSIPRAKPLSEGDEMKKFMPLIASVVGFFVGFVVTYNVMTNTTVNPTTTPATEPGLTVDAITTTTPATAEPGLTVDATTTTTPPTAYLNSTLTVVDMRCDGMPVTDAILFRPGELYMLAKDNLWVNVSPVNTGLMIHFRETERTYCTFWVPTQTCGEENFSGLTTEIYRSLPEGQRPHELPTAVCQ